MLLSILGLSIFMIPLFMVGLVAAGLIGAVIDAFVAVEVASKLPKLIQGTWEWFISPCTQSLLADRLDRSLKAIAYWEGV